MLLSRTQNRAELHQDIRESCTADDSAVQCNHRNVELPCDLDPTLLARHGSGRSARLATLVSQCLYIGGSVSVSVSVSASVSVSVSGEVSRGQSRSAEVTPALFQSVTAFRVPDPRLSVTAEAASSLSNA